MSSRDLQVTVIVHRDSQMFGTQKGCLQKHIFAKGLLHLHRCMCVSEQKMHFGEIK